MSSVNERLKRLRPKKTETESDNTADSQSTQTSPTSELKTSSRFGKAIAKKSAAPLPPATQINAEIPAHQAIIQSETVVDSEPAPVAPARVVSPAMNLSPDDPGEGSLTHIPAASKYSARQWAEYEMEAGEDFVVVEFQDVRGHRLAKIPRVRNHPLEGEDDLEAKLFGRSILIESSTYREMEGAPDAHATYVFKDFTHKACTETTYMVIRNQKAIEKMPWLNGIIWRNWAKDDGTSEAQRLAAAARAGHATVSSRFTSKEQSSGSQSGSGQSYRPRG